MKKLLSCLLVVALVGCSSNPAGNAGSYDLAAITEKIYAEVDSGKLEMGAMQELDDTMLETFYGLDSSVVESHSVMIALINVKADEIAMITAKEGKGDEVKAGIEKRLADAELSWSSYLPDQLEAVKNALVWNDGDTYFMVIGENAEAIQKIIKG